RRGRPSEGGARPPTVDASFADLELGETKQRRSVVHLRDHRLGRQMQALETKAGHTTSPGKGACTPPWLRARVKPPARCTGALRCGSAPCRLGRAALVLAGRLKTGTYCPTPC